MRIEDHEWSDGDIAGVGVFQMTNAVFILISDPSGDCAQAYLDRKDAIALARHYQLTKEEITE